MAWRFLFFFISTIILACSKDKPAPIGPATKVVATTDAPTVPTNLRVETLTDTSARVAWDAVEGATDYDVNYKTLKGRWTNEPHKGIRLYNTIYDLEPDTEYRWAVRAENPDGASAWVYGKNFTTEPAWYIDIIEALTDSSDTTDTVATDESFDIELVYSSDLPDRLIHSAHKAKERLETIITDDLPNVGDIDDVRIHVSVSDTLGQYIGWGETWAARNNSRGLPYEGQIIIAEEVFDKNHALDKNQDMFDALVLHEIVHVLGFGTIPAFKKHCKLALFISWYYEGPSVVKILQTMNPDRSVIFLKGTNHWSWLTGDELMISGWEYPYKAPLSKLTIAALDDIGYQVDYDQSDPYDSFLGAMAKPQASEDHSEWCRVIPLED